MTKYSPSFVYLSQHSDDQETAFLSESDGFMPPLPLPALPPPFSKWHNLATQIPLFYESGEWNSFIASLPCEEDFDLAELLDQHLIRANVALGSIAHAIYHVAKKSIPSSISKPWKEVSSRLGRSIPFLAPIEFLIYSLEPLPEHVGQKVNCAYAQLRPSITMTNTKAEHSFIMVSHSVEHAARPLPMLVTKAQNAVMNDNDRQLRNALIGIIDALENMTKAFTKPDARPLNKFAMDTVHWSRVVDIFTLPVEKDGKGSSGLLLPIFHLIDAFFCRKKYETEFGKLVSHERSWLPHIHQQFLSKVTEISVVDYLISKKKKELLILFRRAMLCFCGENGFLDRHRIRATGYMEVMFKVGRPATGLGAGKSVSWEKRIWRVINRHFKESMIERVGVTKDWYTDATVKEVSPIPGCNAIRLSIDGHGAFHYKPGDLLSILPENRDSLVQKVLHLLNVSPETNITVKDRHWIQQLACRGRRGREDEDELAQITVVDFLRYAKLQPLDRNLSSRIADVMPLTDPTMVELLKAGEVADVKDALQSLQRGGLLCTQKLVQKLDEVFEPLAPRWYSIALHIQMKPTMVEIVVGQVQYEAKPLISHQTSLPGSHNKHPLEACKDFAFKVSSDSTSGDEDEEACKGQRDHARAAMRGSTRAFRRSEYFLESPYYPSEPQQNGAPKVAHPSASVQLCNTENERRTETLQGISSTYLRTMCVGNTITARIVSNPDFHLPKDLNIPVIMIAHGTGFAPFRAFLQHLILLAKRNKRAQHKSWLILGVKSSQEVPFLTEIERAVCTFKVVDVSLAISREDVELDENTYDTTHLNFRHGERKHVQDLFHPSRMELYKLWHMVTQQNAEIYVCGKPNLELMTRNALATAARHFSRNQDPTRFADSLAANKRLHADCYDSSKPVQHGPIYSHSQVAQHRHQHDCWVIFRGGVYDITRFLSVHPGGLKLLMEKSGRDITMDFETSHGADNYRLASMLEAYRIGQLDRYGGVRKSVRTLIMEWSVPLLADMLERRGIFLLDWNQFEEGERKRYVRAREAEEMLQKFEKIHEAQLFSAVQSALRKAAAEELDGLKDVANQVEAVRDVGKVRLAAWASAVAERADGEEVHAALCRCAAATEMLVELALRMQRELESVGDSAQVKQLVPVLRRQLLQFVRRAYSFF